MGFAMNHEPTFELVKKAQAGDAKAFGCLLESFSSRLETLIHLRLGMRLRHKIEPEDIVQETSLRAFRSIQKFRWVDEGSFYRWIAGIAEHVIQNQVRYYFETVKRMGGKSKNQPIQAGSVQDLNAIPEADGLTPLRRLLRQERFDRLEKALQSLAPDHREVIILARIEELPMEEIAIRMNRSADAVSMLLLRALRQLKNLFGTTGSFGLPDRTLNPEPKVERSGDASTLCAPSLKKLSPRGIFVGMNGSERQLK